MQKKSLLFVYIYFSRFYFIFKVYFILIHFVSSIEIQDLKKKKKTIYEFKKIKFLRQTE